MHTYTVICQPMSAALSGLRSMDPDAVKELVATTPDGNEMYRVQSEFALDEILDQSDGVLRWSDATEPVTITKPVTIVKVDTIIERDPYRADTDGESVCELWIDPRNRTAGVRQAYPGQNGTPSNEYHNLVLTGWPDDLAGQFPEQKAMAALLKGDAGQQLLAIVCDEHTITWDGSNMVGSLSEPGDAALQALMDAIQRLPTVDWETWDVDYYYAESLDAVAATSTDAELAALVATWTAEIPDNVRVYGDLAGLLRKQREVLREEELD